MPRENLKHQMLEVIIQHMKHGMLSNILHCHLYSSEKQGGKLGQLFGKFVICILKIRDFAE